MSMGASPFNEHEPRIEGLPIPRSYVKRREVSPETMRILELTRKLQEQQETEERLRYLAYHDELTGLPNARSFSEVFELSAGEAITRNEKLGLVLADIDGLKYTNDTFGHDKGNELIKSIADVLKSRSRPEDQIFRLGGDEFAVILPGYDPDTSKDQTQEQLDLAISGRYMGHVHQAIEQIGLPLNFVNLSVGAAAVEPHESPREFFRRVDGILYSRKPRNDDSRLKPLF